MLDLLRLSPDDLRSEAQRLARPKDAKEHWSVLATVLGRVHDEDLWRRYADGDGLLYESWREWASEELGLPGDEAVTLLKLWSLMRAARDEGVAFDRWPEVTKSRALVLRRLAAAGLSVARCLALSDAYPRVEDFERAARLKLGGKEVWHREVIQMPDPTLQVWRAALVEALAALDPSLSPDRIQDRDVLHQLVAALSVAYLQRAVPSDT